MTLQTSELARTVIGLAIEVHRNLGPGLLESTYQRCLAHELKGTGLRFQAQVPVPVAYKDLAFDCGYRADMVVEGALLLELKSIERLLPIHVAQTLTYLKLSGLKQGLLINFNVGRLVDGLKSVVN